MGNRRHENTSQSAGGTASGRVGRETGRPGLSRRSFVALTGLAGAGAIAGCGGAQPVAEPAADAMEPSAAAAADAAASQTAREAGAVVHHTGGHWTLPELPWAYDALDGSIDAETMEIHHSRHHQAYVNNLNAAIDEHPQYFDWTLEEMLMRLDELPDDIRTAVRNNGGGHYNHALFWQVMSPDGTRRPEGPLAVAIERDLGGWGPFQDTFGDAAAGVFGSGWAWLSADRGGRLRVHGTPNQDTPLAEGYVPLMGVDVWEHAYYLRYQNERGRYVEAFLEVLDWDAVARRYDTLIRS